MTIPYLRLVPLPKKGLDNQPKVVSKMPLFRGKTTGDNPRWVYGDLSSVKETEDGVESSDAVYIAVQVLQGSECSVQLYPVDPETVGQYTTCNDDNKKLIFEDDIVETALSAAAGYQYLAVWEDEGFYFEPFSRDGEVPEEEDHLHEWGFISSPDNGRIIVVGNSHDNPDLLPVVEGEVE
jgi:uncharacterized phage protein (TIGR01671 family)